MQKGRKPLMKTKNQYQVAIANYLIRRREYKEKYGESSEQYKAKSKMLGVKLTTWRKAVAVLQKREDTIYHIAYKVEEFTGHSPMNCFRTQNKATQTARNIFVKYAMENGITGTYLAEYIGMKFKFNVSKYRLDFTRSFKTNPENREMYHRFKDFIKQQEIKQAA